MSTIRFDGKIAIVTGAGGGLGKAYAKLLASRGAKVLVNDLGGDFTGQGSNPGYAEAAAADIRAAGGIAEANGDSVADTKGATAIVQQALDRWGGVDILVNNAGVVTSNGSLSDVTDESYAIDLGVAAGGTFRMMRAVWRHMMDKNYGRIVNVSSGSFFGMGSAVPYPAAKGAVIGMTRGAAVATDFLQRNIKLNVIMPISWSRMTALMGPEIESAMQRDFPPERVAPVVAWLAHEDVPCNGEIFTAGGGRFARVFIGVTEGYRGTTKDISVEDVRDHFEDAMRIEPFTIPKHALEEAGMHESSVDWSTFFQFIA
ncbi:MAG: 3-hydroxyacyl-CoA dehydrogenase [Deltaproteobacteria bacterium]|nr:3-hydroxyacyl-CoA dehydrogenase [Deltaproteobacteria bacterium]